MLGSASRVEQRLRPRSLQVNLVVVEPAVERRLVDQDCRRSVWVGASVVADGSPNIGFFEVKVSEGPDASVEGSYVVVEVVVDLPGVALALVGLVAVVKESEEPL